MSLNASAIADAIAGLSVTGVTIKAADDLPLSVKTTDCPIFMPVPNGWVGATTGSPDEETTFGTPSTRDWITHRIFHYVYLHRMLVSKTIDTKYADAVTNTEALWSALAALDVANVDVENITHTDIDTLQDKAGNSFVGCFFDVTIRERINP